MTGTSRIQRRRAWADGFTLIELLVVVSLVIILASIGMAQYRSGVTRAQEAVLKEDLYRLRDVIDQFYADKQKYPQTLEELVEGQYLRAIPKDPFTGSADTWQLIQAEPDPANPTAELGVVDVKSGSDKKALDGSTYSEW
ncbi:MAG: type II secretion system GspH family protein [Vicinamibacterales bacterium]|nr:type II secretion system GspH family protein [Vicinamibacterales bacterium]